jgi:hypothetical protein
MGWLPDYPDLRDYTIDHDSLTHRLRKNSQVDTIKTMLNKTGVYLRHTMGAVVLFGVPPEKNWPYVIEDFDKEPGTFCYTFAQNYQSISYYRLDPPGTNPGGSETTGAFFYRNIISQYLSRSITALPSTVPTCTSSPRHHSKTP